MYYGMYCSQSRDHLPGKGTYDVPVTACSFVIAPQLGLLVPGKTGKEKVFP